MSPLPDKTRTQLVDVTREYERIETIALTRALGSQAYEAALEQEELQTEIMSSLEQDEVIRYSETAPEQTEPTLADRLDDARADFFVKVRRLFGEINGYELGYAELGGIMLLQRPDKEADPDNDKYSQLNVSVGAYNNVNLDKNIKASRTRMFPEPQLITPDDEATVVAALGKLEEINLVLAQDDSLE